MPLPTLPDIPLSYGSSVQEAHRKKDDKSIFGDGYSQREKDGLNTNMQEGSLSYKNISEEDGETLRVFFAGLGGVDAFQWQPWGQPAVLKWVTKGAFRIQPSGHLRVDCRVNIEQVFDLD